MRRRSVLLGGAALAIAGRGRAAETPLKIGILNDQSGIFADYQGPGSVLSAQMALEEAGGKSGARPVEIVSADHQNKPDVGMAIARRWLDEEGVDVIMDVPNSAIALAVAGFCTERNKVLVAVGGGTAELTGAHCSPNIVHWGYDTWEASHAMGQAVTQRGGKTWFTLTADYAFGIDLDKNVREAVEAFGGKVVGGVRAPFPTSDFSSFLLQAQASGAQVLCLNNAGGDMLTSLKQAAEFGLNRAMTICGATYNVNITKGAGLSVCQGVLGVTPFYWDMNDATRAFSKRWQARDRQHAMPNDMQAGVYSATLGVIKAASAVSDPSDGRALVAAMKATPMQDPLYGPVTIREDGRKMQDVYLFQTKTPAESHGDWDFYKILSTIPAEQAFRPLAEGHCPMVKS